MLPGKSLKQCKARWFSVVGPRVKKTEWTHEEGEEEKSLQIEDDSSSFIPGEIDPVPRPQTPLGAEALEFIEETTQRGYSIEEATAMYKEMAGEDGVLDGELALPGSEAHRPKRPAAEPAEPGWGSKKRREQLGGQLGGTTPAEELRMLTVKELRMRAAAEGADEDAIEDARDSDTPKESLIELILATCLPMAR